MQRDLEGGIRTMGTWEVLEHTADVGLKIHADSWPDVLETAARGMVALLLHRPPTEPAEQRKIKVAEDDFEDALVAWLQELVYIFETEQLVPVDFKFVSAKPEHVEANVGFAKFDVKRHQPHTEIKAATYHELFVRQAGNKWQAQVIFDV